MKTGLDQLEQIGLDKRRRATLDQELSALAENDDFWRLQAHSLAVLATPESLRTFRLATTIMDTVQVSDRFHLKPLLRAIAFPQNAFVLALSENSVRLLEVFPDAPPSLMRIHDLPKNAADAVGRAFVNNLTQNTRIANAEGQTTLLRQYARNVDAALRGVLAGREVPLILAATDPLGPIFRGLNSYPALLNEGISTSPDRLSEQELASAARPVLDGYYKNQIQAAKELYEARSGQRCATLDIGEAARAATSSAIELLVVDIDQIVPGNVSDDGSLTLESSDDAKSYDILDEIAGRAILSGAKFLGVRHSDIPGGAPLMALLRYPI